MKRNKNGLNMIREDEKDAKKNLIKKADLAEKKRKGKKRRRNIFNKVAKLPGR